MSAANINFDLLALLVEKLSKMTFEDYIHKNIFAPAEMKNTFSRTSLSYPTPLHSEAYNYDYPYMYSEKMMRVNDMFWLERVKMEYHNLFGLLGDGSIYSTVLDMQKYDEALYSGTLLKPSTLELAFSPSKLNNGKYAEINIGIGKAYYGLGWEIFDDTTSGKIVWHAGGRPGCWTIFLRNITKNQTVILLDNAENFGAYKYALTAMNLLNNKSPLVQKKSLAKIYGIALLSNGADYALGKLFQLKDDSINYRLSEPEMNNLGYELRNNNYRNEALETFKVTTLLFPKSGNAFDSYGETLLLYDKEEEAILMYKKSIVLDPKNEGGKKVLQELLK